MSFENHAAYLVDKKNQPLQVRSAPYTKPGPNEIAVKASAVALNPVDLVVQVAATLAFNYISNLFVLGQDVSGQVVEVGMNVDPAQFEVGDRVVGHAVAFDKRSKGAPEGAFQEYVVLRTNLAAKIPSDMSYERATVIPLGFSTAACALFQKEQLALAHPQTSKAAPQNKTVIIWGGSTSVGANAIQLARAAGYDVIATSSPKNFGFVKELGASQAFDYNDSKTPNAIIQHLKGKECAGAVAIGKGSLEACQTILGATKGRKFVAQLSAPIEITHKRPGILDLKFVNGSDLMLNEVGKAVYNDFLGDALVNGNFVPKPDPEVVGHGLESINEAFAVYRKGGVSAKKLVVIL
ncbi:zinc-binding oxidoreductase CipB [Lophiotrema nucula]|uniref:Zinc-binding oxidoreductase CipB n=1 Tax=Lophiotrema nucula TaxID=690887 RepID=A0A6A5YVC2_9PLEO|nr:zinc-binding oxidoreductase CipB [Lophiotrema nucula]